MENRKRRSPRREYSIRSNIYTSPGRRRRSRSLSRTSPHDRTIRTATILSRQRKSRSRSPLYPRSKFSSERNLLNGRRSSSPEIGITENNDGKRPAYAGPENMSTLKEAITSSSRIVIVRKIEEDPKSYNEDESMEQRILERTRISRNNNSRGSRSSRRNSKEYSERSSPVERSSPSRSSRTNSSRGFQSGKSNTEFNHHSRDLEYRTGRNSGLRHDRDRKVHSETYSSRRDRSYDRKRRSSSTHRTNDSRSKRRYENHEDRKCRKNSRDHQRSEDDHSYYVDADEQDFDKATADREMSDGQEDSEYEPEEVKEPEMGMFPHYLPPRPPHIGLIHRPPFIPLPHVPLAHRFIRCPPLPPPRFFPPFRPLRPPPIFLPRIYAPVPPTY